MSSFIPHPAPSYPPPSGIASVKEDLVNWFNSNPLSWRCSWTGEAYDNVVDMENSIETLLSQNPTSVVNAYEFKIGSRTVGYFFHDTTASSTKTLSFMFDEDDLSKWQRGFSPNNPLFKATVLNKPLTAEVTVNEDKNVSIDYGDNTNPETYELTYTEITYNGNQQQTVTSTLYSDGTNTELRPGNPSTGFSLPKVSKINFKCVFYKTYVAKARYRFWFISEYEYDPVDMEWYWSVPRRETNETSTQIHDRGGRVLGPIMDIVLQGGTYPPPYVWTREQPTGDTPTSGACELFYYWESALYDLGTPEQQERTASSLWDYGLAGHVSNPQEPYGFESLCFSSSSSAASSSSCSSSSSSSIPTIFDPHCGCTIPLKIKVDIASLNPALSVANGEHIIDYASDCAYNLILGSIIVQVFWFGMTPNDWIVNVFNSGNSDQYQWSTSGMCNYDGSYAYMNDSIGQGPGATVSVSAFA